ncbi:hypothetical protein QR680_007756 [Steinernema hermaphroditum]|uniref:Uncharacterized protein n=1 Tax=Steinernema hermaphroditum TaxID=289476 RepID=A0AA39IGC3_9BILA|nr:hypothetical protein QR680_007756 [Steinernema hermaphroditum]
MGAKMKALLLFCLASSTFHLNMFPVVNGELIHGQIEENTASQYGKDLEVRGDELDLGNLEQAKEEDPTSGDVLKPRDCWIATVDDGEENRTPSPSLPLYTEERSLPDGKCGRGDVSEEKTEDGDQLFEDATEDQCVTSAKGRLDGDVSEGLLESAFDSDVVMIEIDDQQEAMTQEIDGAPESITFEQEDSGLENLKEEALTDPISDATSLSSHPFSIAGRIEDDRTCLITKTCRNGNIERVEFCSGQKGKKRPEAQEENDKEDSKQVDGQPVHYEL